MTSYMYSNIISKYRDKYSRDDTDNDNVIFNSAYKNNYNPIITKYRIIRRCRQFTLFKDDCHSILGKKRKYDDAFN